jgi:hypothetical protein
MPLRPLALRRSTEPVVTRPAIGRRLAAHAAIVGAVALTLPIGLGERADAPVTAAPPPERGATSLDRSSPPPSALPMPAVVFDSTSPIASPTPEPDDVAPTSPESSAPDDAASGGQTASAPSGEQPPGDDAAASNAPPTAVPTASPDPIGLGDLLPPVPLPVPILPLP